MTSISPVTFHQCTSLTEFIIPPKVTDIQFALFYKFDKLQSVEIQGNVFSIEPHSLESCPNLHYIIYLGKRSPTNKPDIFFGTPIEFVYWVDFTISMLSIR